LAQRNEEKKPVNPLTAMLAQRNEEKKPVNPLKAMLAQRNEEKKPVNPLTQRNEENKPVNRKQRNTDKKALASISEVDKNDDLAFYLNQEFDKKVISANTDDGVLTSFLDLQFVDEVASPVSKPISENKSRSSNELDLDSFLAQQFDKKIIPNVVLETAPLKQRSPEDDLAAMLESEFR